MPPNLTGYYRFVSQENMDNYLRALGNPVLLHRFYSPRSPKASARGIWEGEEGIWATPNLWPFCLPPSLRGGERYPQSWGSLAKE